MRDRFATLDGAMIHRVMNAMCYHKVLAEMVRNQLLDVRLAAVSAAVARAIERGELPADADGRLAGEVASAPMLDKRTAIR